MTMYTVQNFFYLLFLFPAALISMQGQPVNIQGQSPFNLTITPQKHEPFYVKDLVAVGLDLGSSGFDLAARLTAAKDYRNPNVQRFENWSKWCENRSTAWSKEETRNPLYNVDLTNKKQVAALGIGGTIVSLVALKLTLIGLSQLNSAWNSMFSARSTQN